MLVVGMGIVAFAACSKDEDASKGQENVMTMRSDTLHIEQSENGVLKGKFFAPVMEEYAYAPEPYQEYPRGVDVETYDSLGRIESTIRSNYALYWIVLDRWDLKGDVVGTNAEGDVMETQQLSWSQQTERVWSNVQTRLTRNGGIDVVVGTSFESTQDLSEWRLWHGEGTQSFVADPTTPVTDPDDPESGADPNSGADVAAAPVPVAATISTPILSVATDPAVDAVAAVSVANPDVVSVSAAESNPVAPAEDSISVAP